MCMIFRHTVVKIFVISGKIKQQSKREPWNHIPEKEEKREEKGEEKKEAKNCAKAKS